MQRSFLKWAGGKYNALPELLKCLPKEGGLLVEPFMGSCTVALNTNYDRFVLNDYNSDLVFLCQWVAKRPKEVASLLEDLFSKKNNTKEAFYRLRDRYNYSIDKKERALLFLYINRHCFNGLMRYNKLGYINTSFGAYVNPKIPYEELLYFSKKLKNAVFTCGNFENVRFRVDPLCLTSIYSDPPYLPKEKNASVVSYTKLGFKKEQHISLNRASRKWKQRASGVWLSNHDVPVVAECYKDGVSASQFLVRRSISSKGSDRAPAKEIILSY